MLFRSFSSYAQWGDGGHTIHSKGQMESFGLIVDDKSRTAGGSQCIVTNEGYVVPLHVHGGLTYMDMEPASDTDMENYPHVFFCADSPYDPSILDNEFIESDLTCLQRPSHTMRTMILELMLLVTFPSMARMLMPMPPMSHL